MKHFKPFITILITLPLLFTNCTKEELPDRKLVIEGWIESGGHPVVILTTPFRPGSDDSVEDLLARPANITLSDGDTTWQLTGMYDPGYFPPYVYTTFEMQGIAGKSYTLSVLHDGLRASAQTEILEPPVIDGINITPDLKNDKYREVEVVTTPGSECEGEEYVMAFLKVAAGGKRLLPAYMGTYRIECGGESQSIAVKRPKHKLDSLPYYTNFEKGETIEIHLCRLPREAYDFWIAFQNAISVGNSNIITGSYSLPTNIEGDGTGYFFGYGSTIQRLTIE